MTPEQSATASLVFNVLLGIYTFVRLVSTQRHRKKQSAELADIQTHQLGLEGSLKIARDEIATLQDDVKKKDQQRRDADSENRQLVSRVDTLEENNRALDQTARAVDRTNAMLQGRITEQREIFTTQDNLRANEISQLRADVGQRDATIAGLKEQITVLRQSLIDKEDLLIKANETIAGLEQRVIQFDQLQTRVEHLEEQVEELTTKHLQALADLEAERVKNTQARAEKELLIAERDNLLLRVGELEAALAAAQGAPPAAGTPAPVGAEQSGRPQ